MSKTMRFSTLPWDYGPVWRATNMLKDDWLAARASGCYATVYHGESDHCTPLEAAVRHAGCVNTVCKIAWTKPLPKEVERIIGMRDNQDAWDLINP